MVYFQYFAEYYTVPPPRGGDFSSTVLEEELLSLPGQVDCQRHNLNHVRSDGAILRTCELIRLEAFDVLFKKSTFRFCINTSRSDTSSAPYHLAAGRIQKVEFVINIQPYNCESAMSSCNNALLDAISMCILERMRTQYARIKDCRIILEGLHYRGFGEHGPYLYRRLINLSLYTKVVVELHPEKRWEYTAEEFVLNRIRYWTYATTVCLPYLEDCLGPGVVCLERGAGHSYTFQPMKHSGDRFRQIYKSRKYRLINQCSLTRLP